MNTNMGDEGVRLFEALGMDAEAARIASAGYSPRPLTDAGKPSQLDDPQLVEKLTERVLNEARRKGIKISDGKQRPARETQLKEIAPTTAVDLRETGDLDAEINAIAQQWSAQPAKAEQREGTTESDVHAIIKGFQG